MAENRTKYVVKNIGIGILCQILNAGLGFIVRYFFIMALGVEYLGVNGLFGNILQFLSLVELGVGSAIIYRLYAPLKAGNMNELIALMRLYKKAYTFIGLIVLVLGLSLTPFMPWLIKDTSQIDENLYVIYILFVINSTISYFFIYKQSLIIADQKNYIVTIIRQIVKLVQSILQIVVLVFVKNFILFLLVGILFTLITNISISWQANKLYPFLKGGDSLELDTSKKKSLFFDIKSLMLFKLGYIVLNNSNNIVISLFLGVTYIGLGSNYFLITAAFEIIINQLSNAFTASVGNFNVDTNSESKWRLFSQLNIILITFCGLIFSMAYLFSDEFISLWIGNSYSLSTFSVFSIVLFVFLKNTGTVVYMFRTTQGGFMQVRYASIIVSLFHIFLAVLLVENIGFPGVYLSASCAILCLNIYDGFIVSKVSGFKFIKYIWLNIILYITIVILSYIGYYFSDFLVKSNNDWVTFVFRVILYSVIFIIFGHVIFFVINKYYRIMIRQILRI